MKERMTPDPRLRLRLAYALLAGILLPVPYLTVRALEYHPPKPLAPQAVALVKHYLESLRSGDRAAACRIVDLPSLCTSTASFAIKTFSVSAAEPTVDGVQVQATIDNEQALFLLSPVRYGRYRIVYVVADATRPLLGIAPP
jgi:hypothetical protein